MPRKAWILILSLCLTALFAGSASAAAEGEGPPADRATLEIVGRAAVAVVPDIALVAFTVESNDRQAAKALADNARQTETLLKALRDLMGGEDHLQTASINLQPVYDKDNRLRPSGYRVSNRVNLETRQLDRLGAFIDAAAASGAGQIGSLQFRASREAEHRSEAAVLAVGQARADADRLAQAAGARLGRVLQVRYAPQGPPGVFLEKATLAMGRTPVEIGDLTIEAEVVIVFELL
jgi:uncharacterized protein YggE